VQASTVSAIRSPTTRNAVTNSPQLLRGVDGRSIEARRYRDLVISFADDLGGVERLTGADKALCRQAAASVVAAEQVQERLIAGDTSIDLGEATRLSNIAARHLRSLRTRHKPAKRASPLADHFSRPPVREVAG
jgi:hypothetical protein